MKALLLTAKRHLELTDMPTPQIGPQDLLVRIKACGICGSDVHGYDLSTGRRIPPLIMGHEAAGIVEQAGPNATNFKPGDRITFDSTISCGNCHFCRSGHINLCDNRRVLGVSTPDYRQHGCFAEFAAIPERIAYKLPDTLSFEKAAMVEPVSIAVHAASRAPALLGQSVVIVGAGMIGQLLTQVAKLAGADPLIVLDIDPTRLEAAKKEGATHTLKADARDTLQQIQKLTQNRGADIAFEAVGADASVTTAINALRKGGTAILVGNIRPAVSLPLQTVVTKELSLLGTAASNGEYPTCLGLLAKNKIQVDSLLTATAPLEDGPQWFDRLYNKEPNLMKVLLTP